MIVLFLIVFVGMVGFGIILPIFPFYAERVGASPTAITWTMAAFTLGQAVAAPIWGRISDAYGRRVVLMLTMVGASLAYVMLAYADSLWLVIASRVFGGLMAGNIATAFAYVAGITTEEDRPAGLGKVGAAMGLGFIFGPALGGLLAGTDVATANFVAPALTAAGISVAAMLGTFLFLPESLPPESRTPFFGGHQEAWEEAASLAALNRSGLMMLFVAALVFYTGMAQTESIFPLWAKDAFGLGPRDIGMVFFLLGVITVVMQGGLIGPLSRRFGEQQTRQRRRRVFLCRTGRAGVVRVGLARLAGAVAVRHRLGVVQPGRLQHGVQNGRAERAGRYHGPVPERERRPTG